MYLRAMELADIEQVVILEQHLFTSSWSKSDFLYELINNDFAHYFVVEDQGNIVAYVGLWVMYEQSQITTIGVDKDYQRQGIGQDMLQSMIDFSCQNGCQMMTLEVRVSNMSAISLYEKLGFHKEALRKDYYQDNHEDAYLMVKKLEVFQ